MMPMPNGRTPLLVFILVLSLCGGSCRAGGATGLATPLATGAPDPAERPDGWAGAASAPPNPGGAAAASSAYTVGTRSEFLSALKAGGSSLSDAPKVIYVDGMIDLCADAGDSGLSPEDFISQAGLGASYATYQAYIAAYAASCSTGAASSLEPTRQKLAARQKAVVVVKVGSNTSILGKGPGAGFEHGSLTIDGKTNVIIRNLSVLDAYDYFPSWDPADSNGGMINSEYDTISITNASTYIWVDHCDLGDGDRPDSSLPHVSVSGVDKKWVSHDGLVDVTKGSNYVTLSWNRIGNHDKTFLFGSSDSAGATDAGAIKVTVHHNRFEGLGQRLPRVRFGQVHVFNNYYKSIGSYAVGVGDLARIYSESNCFDGVAKAFAAYDDAANVGYYFDSGSLGLTGDKAMATAEQLGWKPSDAYAYSAQGAEAAQAAVLAAAGTGRF